MPHLPRSTHWIFASSGVCSAIVLVPAQSFILIYYSQVLGLSASLAGVAMAVALIIDAVLDPAVGFVSDNWKSRWGRRHPFLYASTVLIPLFYLLLWLPPSGLSKSLLFLYLLISLIGLRFAVALFEIPGNALLPELTSDYEERTRMFIHKEWAYWLTGALVGGVLMYGFWLRPTATYPDGFLNPEGYRAAARDTVPIAVAALVVFSVGLHRFIPYLSAPSVVERFGIREFLRQSFDVLRLPSLRMMILAGVVSATAYGVYLALWPYTYGYFWETSSSQLSYLMLASGLGALPAFYLMPWLVAGREKRLLAVWLTLGSNFLVALPIVLRLMGTFPANGSTNLFWVLMAVNFVLPIFQVLVMGVLTSMMADLVEQSQLETARRSEGMILASIIFTRKAAMAIGTLLAGVALDLVGFPAGAAVGEVPAASLFKFGLIYGPGLMVLGVLAAYITSRYKITRLDHERAVEALARVNSNVNRRESSEQI